MASVSGGERKLKPASCKDSQPELSLSWCLAHLSKPKHQKSDNLQKRSPMAQWRALVAIRTHHIKGHRSSISRFRRQGGLEPLLGLIRQTDCSRKTLDLALSILGNCCTEKETCTEVRKLDGINIIVEVMKKHLGQLSIQNRAARVLGNLAMDPENSALIHAAGGVPLLLLCVSQTPASSPSSTTSSCSSTPSSPSSPCTPSPTSTTTTTTTATTASTSPSSSSSAESSPALECAQSAARALFYLSDSAPHRLSLVSQGAVASLCPLAAPDLPPAPRRASLRALHELTKGCGVECARQVVRCGGLSLIGRAAAGAEGIEKGDEELALKTLANLCAQGCLRPLVGSLDVIKKFAEEVRKDALKSGVFLKALCLCCKEAVNRAKVKECGGLELLIGFLASHQSHPLSRSVIQACVDFVFDEAAVEQFLELGLVPLLVERLVRLSKGEEPVCAAGSNPPLPDLLPQGGLDSYDFPQPEEKREQALCSSSFLSLRSWLLSEGLISSEGDLLDSSSTAEPDWSGLPLSSPQSANPTAASTTTTATPAPASAQKPSPVPSPRDPPQASSPSSRDPPQASSPQSANPTAASTTTTTTATPAPASVQKPSLSPVPSPRDPPQASSPRDLPQPSPSPRDPPQAFSPSSRYPPQASSPSPRDPPQASSPSPRDPPQASSPTSRYPPQASSPSPRDPPQASSPTSRYPPQASSPSPREPPQAFSPSSRYPPQASSSSPSPRDPPQASSPSSRDPPQASSPSSRDPPQASSPSSRDPPQASSPSSRDPPQASSPSPSPRDPPQASSSSPSPRDAPQASSPSRRDPPQASSPSSSPVKTPLSPTRQRLCTPLRRRPRDKPSVLRFPPETPPSVTRPASYHPYHPEPWTAESPLLLLLSRFSHVPDPSAALASPAVISGLLLYLTSRGDPSGRCFRMLLRLSVNPNCLQALVRSGAAALIRCQLCDHGGGEEEERGQQSPRVKAKVRQLGLSLLSNLQLQCESGFGAGVLSHLMLSGTESDRLHTALSLPLITSNKTLLRKLLLDSGGLQFALQPLGADTDSDRTDPPQNPSPDLPLRSLYCPLLVGCLCALTQSSKSLKPTNCEKNDRVLPPPPKKPRFDQPRCPYSAAKLDLAFLLDDGTEVSANHAALSGEETSEYFRALLKGGFGEASSKGAIPIRDVSRGTLAPVLHYLHGCRFIADGNETAAREGCQTLGAVVNAGLGRNDDFEKSALGEAMVGARRFLVGDLQKELEDVCVSLLNSEDIFEKGTYEDGQEKQSDFEMNAKTQESPAFKSPKRKCLDAAAAAKDELTDSILDLLPEIYWFSQRYSYGRLGRSCLSVLVRRRCSQSKAGQCLRRLAKEADCVDALKKDLVAVASDALS